MPIFLHRSSQSTFATQRIVVLWSHNTTTPTQNPHDTHDTTTICCVVADNSQRNMKPFRNGSRSNGWSYYCGNIIIYYYYVFFLLRIIVSFQLPLRIYFRFWRHNKLLRCDLNTKHNNIPTHTSRHNNWLCRGVLCGNCCVAGFCVGRLAHTGHRDYGNVEPPFLHKADETAGCPTR